VRSMAADVQASHSGSLEWRRTVLVCTLALSRRETVRFNRNWDNDASYVIKTTYISSVYLVRK
jgi:hypothetical protein